MYQKKISFGIYITFLFLFWVLFFLFSLLGGKNFSAQASEAYNEDIDAHTLPSVESLYMQNYEAIVGNQDHGNKIDTQAIEVIADQTKIPKALLYFILSGNKCDDSNCSPKMQKILEAKCPRQSEQLYSWIQCRTTLQDAFEEEQERQIFVERQLQQALRSQIFLNGTLQDTNGEMFDIIVDLNRIDIILFGSNAVMPHSTSPFFPRKKSQEKIFSDKENSNNNSNQNTNNQNQEDNNSSSNSNNNNNNTNTDTTDHQNQEDNNDSQASNLEEFCVDPEALIFSNTSSNTSQTTSHSNNNSDQNQEDNNNQYSLSYAQDIDASLGNFFDTNTNSFDGNYPDITKFKSTANCKKDEEEFLGGRICIPKFCTKLICIKITMTPGFRGDDNLRTENCVECHIERGNKALSPLVAMIGKNTPNTNSMEPFFLSAFANLFKHITNGITIYKKPLPFFVYDTPLHKQKAQQEKKYTQEESRKKILEKKQNTEKVKIIAQQHHTMSTIRNKCNEMQEIFSSRPSTYLLSEYCSKIDAQQQQKYSSINTDLFDAAIAEQQQHIVEQSKMYHNIVQPFFLQLSNDMKFVNKHFFVIIPGEIERNKLSCTVRAQ